MRTMKEIKKTLREYSDAQVEEEYDRLGGIRARLFNKGMEAVYDALEAEMKRRGLE